MKIYTQKKKMLTEKGVQEYNNLKFYKINR